MLLKKPTIALCSSGSLSSTLSLPAHASATSSTNCPATTPSQTPSTSLHPRNKSRVLPTSWRGSRFYATIQNNSQQGTSNRHAASNKPTPHDAVPVWPTTAHPTPYDIFAQAKTAPYSKKTFYQLVKLYHPDRHPHSSPTLSHAVKLDRYRLVVAANTILSDPIKRRAYDLYGAGWAGTHDMSNKTFRDADRAWRREAGSAAGNATWEDWEQWHRAHDGANSGEKQTPLYMSNGLFVGALALFVVVGSWGQVTRAGNHSVHLIEMRETSSQNISEEMWKRRREKAILGREERIATFLRQREGWDHGSRESHMPKD